MSTEQEKQTKEDEAKETEVQTDQSVEPTDAASDEQIEAAADDNPLQSEIDDLKEKLLLAHADMQNVRRRAERDVENAHKYALEKIVADLLSVVDNLERAIAAIDTTDEAMKPVVDGVELTLKSFLDVLRRYQVETVDPKGEPFDPEKHQAMTMVPSADVPPNTVIEVFQKGYLLNGRLVRPAMVVVSQGSNS